MRSLTQQRWFQDTIALLLFAVVMLALSGICNSQTFGFNTLDSTDKVWLAKAEKELMEMRALAFPEQFVDDSLINNHSQIKDRVRTKSKKGTNKKK